MTNLRPMWRTAGAALAGLAILAAGAGAAGASQPIEANNQPQLYGSNYELQNNFNFAGQLIPFFDQYSGRVSPKVEVRGGYIYDIDIKQRAITMAWNTDAEWDIYEPFVGALNGITQEQAAALPIADEYWITFDKPVSDLVFTADPDQTLVPNVRVEGEYTVVVSIPGGTTIGDGFNAVINVARAN